MFGSNVSCAFGAKLYEDQIEVLRKFIDVITIPDPDIAGKAMVQHLQQKLYNDKDVKFIWADTDDKNPDYEEIIKNSKIRYGYEVVSLI